MVSRVFEGFDWWICRLPVVVGGGETLSWLLAGLASSVPRGLSQLSIGERMFVGKGRLF